MLYKKFTDLTHSSDFETARDFASVSDVDRRRFDENAFNFSVFPNYIAREHWGSRDEDQSESSE